MLARNCLSLEIFFPPCHLMIKVNAFLSSTFPQNIKRILFEQQQKKKNSLMVLKEVEKPQPCRSASRFLYDKFITLVLLETSSN